MRKRSVRFPEVARAVCVGTRRLEPRRTSFRVSFRACHCLSKTHVTVRNHPDHVIDNRKLKPICTDTNQAVVAACHWSSTAGGEGRGNGIGRQDNAGTQRRPAPPPSGRFVIRRQRAPARRDEPTRGQWGSCRWGRREGKLPPLRPTSSRRRPSRAHLPGCLLPAAGLGG